MKNNKVKLGHKPEEIRKPGLVPAGIAALFTLLIPGLGQVLGRAIRRGLIILFSFINILGLMAWRFKITAPRDEGWVAIIKKGFHLDKSLVITAVLLGLLYLWTIFDAYIISKHRERTPIGVFFLIIVVFFTLGWQIGQIDLLTLITEADEAGAPLSRLAVPWQKAIVRDEEKLTGRAKIQVPCSDEEPPPEPSTTPEGEPLLIASPTCGSLTTQEGEKGTTLHLEGYNFGPGEETQLKWKDPIGNVFRHRQEGEYVKVVPDDEGHFETDVVMPYRLLPPSADEPFYIWEVFAEQTAAVGPPHLSKEFKIVVEKMVETIFIGMMATFLVSS